MPLGPESELRTTHGQTLDIDGSSYLRGTSVNIYILSTPILIGVADVTPRGTFSTTVTIPPTITLGKHTIQVVGVNPGNELSRASLGISVITTNPGSLIATSPIGTQVAFIGDSARLTRGSQTSLLSLLGQVPTGSTVTGAAIRVRVAKDATAAEITLARARADSVINFLKVNGVSGPFTKKIIRAKGTSKFKLSQRATAKVSLSFSL